MSFLKSLIRRVKRTVTAVATAAIGGALSSAAGAAIRPLGSKITRNLGSLFKKAATGLKSLFVRRANAPPLNVAVPDLTSSVSRNRINLDLKPPKF